MAHKDEPSDGVNLSRRNFLKSTGVVGIAATVIAPAGARRADRACAAVGPGDVPVRLTVNGRPVDLKIEPRVTLLDALRMRADLTGNKRVLRSRRLRRLHDDRRRPHGLLVLDAGDRGAGQADPHRRRPRQRRRRCTRCSRRSATRTR